MTQHAHHDGDHEAGLADLLDLDAQVLGPQLDEMTEWVERHARGAVRTIVDIGAGTGTGSLALARRFPSAEVIALDRSPVMLERLRTAARDQPLADRLRGLVADLDVGWPDISSADLAWAASSLHHVADPDRVLREVHSALRPGGLLVVVEMDTLPRFLPEDIGLGRPGLEARCHEAAARMNWNSHPNWRLHLERAGFQVTEQRGFTLVADQQAANAGRYAQAFLQRIRFALDDQLAADDLDVLDRLLAGDGPDALLCRSDLRIRSGRTAWAAHKAREW